MKCCADALLLLSRLFLNTQSLCLYHGTLAVCGSLLALVDPLHCAKSCDNRRLKWTANGNEIHYICMANTQKTYTNIFANNESRINN